MKKSILVLSFLFLSTPALATDQNLLVCTKAEGNSVIFKVTGDQAKVAVNQVSEFYKVTKELSARTGRELEEFKSVIGEEAVSADGYMLEGETDSLALWVVTGKSGNTTLVSVGLDITVIGNDRFCRRQFASGQISAQSALLLLRVLEFPK